MREYQIADEKKVKQAVARYLNTTDFTLRFIDTGLFNTSYYIEQEDEEYVIRIAPPDDAGFIFYEKNMMAQEPDCTDSSVRTLLSLYPTFLCTMIQEPYSIGITSLWRDFRENPCLTCTD